MKRFYFLPCSFYHRRVGNGLSCGRAPSSAWRHPSALKHCWRRFCLATRAKYSVVAKIVRKGKERAIKQQLKKERFTFLFKNGSDIHFVLQQQRKINRASMNCGLRNYCLCWFPPPRYTGWNPIRVGAENSNYSCRCLLLLFKDVTFPELHSISPSDGDATESRSVLSLSTKQKTLGTKNVTGRKEKRGRKKQNKTKQGTSPNHQHPLVKNKEKNVF